MLNAAQIELILALVRCVVLHRNTPDAGYTRRFEDHLLSVGLYRGGQVSVLPSSACDGWQAARQQTVIMLKTLQYSTFRPAVNRVGSL